MIEGTEFRKEAIRLIGSGQYGDGPGEIAEFLEDVRDDGMGSIEYEDLFDLLSRCGGMIHTLLTAYDECKRQQAAGHDALNDVVRRWRKIGYEKGYSDGYGDALNP